MDSMAIVINSQTKLTYDDYVQFPADGKRHEIIDGEHYVTPAPETYHQKVSRLMQFQLMQQILFPGSLKLTPRVSFAPPILASELLAQADRDDVQRLIVERAQALLSAHMEREAPGSNSGPEGM